MRIGRETFKIFRGLNEQVSYLETETVSLRRKVDLLIEKVTILNDVVSNLVQKVDNEPVRAETSTMSDNAVPW